MKKAVQLVLTSGLSVLTLWLVFADINGHALWHILQQVHPLWVLGYLLCLGVTQICRAWRWRTLILPLAPVDLASAWRMSNVGNMLIMLLPLRLGEFSRPYMLKKQYGRPLSAGMGAAVVERVLDGLIVTLLFFATTALIDRKYEVPAALRLGANVALSLFAGASLVIVVTLWSHDALPHLVRRLCGARLAPLADKALALLAAFVDGMRALPNVAAICSVLATTLLYWAANALGMVCLIHAFSWDLPLLAGATLVCVLVIGVMIPAGPGLLGTYQAAIVAGLSTYHVDKNAGAAFSLVAYLGNLAVIVAFGLPHLLGRSSLDVHGLMHADEEREFGPV